MADYGDPSLNEWDQYLQEKSSNIGSWVASEREKRGMAGLSPYPSVGITGSDVTPWLKDYPNLRRAVSEAYDLSPMFFAGIKGVKPGENGVIDASEAFAERAKNNKPEPEYSKGFWHDENDHSFSDKAKYHMDQMQARGIPDDAISAAQMAPDHMTYMNPNGFGKYPLPNFSAKPTGTIGEPRIQGGPSEVEGSMPDPFSWMDDKYKATKQLMDRHESIGMPAEIHTSSDLIAKKDYIDKIPEGSTVNFHMLAPEKSGSVNGSINNKMFPGNPSYARQLDAIAKLHNEGIKVNRIDPTVESYIRDSKASYNRNPERMTGMGMSAIKEHLQGLGLLTDAQKGALPPKPTIVPEGD